MSLRRINWGGESGQYATQIDPDGDGRAKFLVDTSDGTVLLEYDENAGELVSRGPVNLSGEDLSNVGAIDSTSVSTGRAYLAQDEITIPVGTTRDVTTISEAINQIPGMGSFNTDAPTVILSLAEGETFSPSSEVWIKHPWATIQIEGEGAGATVEFPAGSEGFVVLATEVRLSNVTVQPADPANPHNRSIKADRGSRIQLRDGTTVSGAATRDLHAQAGCKVTVMSGATVSAGNTNDVGIWIHSGSHLGLNGTVEDYTTGVVIDRSSSFDGINPTLSGNTTHVKVEDGSSAKIEGSNASVTDGTTAMEVASGGYGRIEADVTLTNVAEVELDRTYAGGMYERQNGAVVIGTADGTIQSGGNSLFFRDDSGVTQMRHDLDTGDLVLSGSLTENGSP